MKPLSGVCVFTSPDVPPRLQMRMLELGSVGGCEDGKLRRRECRLQGHAPGKHLVSVAAPQLGPTTLRWPLHGRGFPGTGSRANSFPFPQRCLTEE